jgi:chorismate-pyruvate lyase
MQYEVLNVTDISLRSQALPFYIRDVLALVFYRHSTTALIRKKSGFHLNVLSTNPYRDVEIFNGSNLLMYARTIAPEITQNALKGIYSFQKPAPIGDFLFHSPDVKRTQVTLELVKKIPDWLQEYEVYPKVYWVRETIWKYKNQYSMTLIEIFC